MSEGIKGVFEILAKYNKLTNQDMVEVLENVDAANLTEDRGAYYKSIMGILNHHLSADINWLRTLSTHVPNLSFLSSRLERFPSERISPGQLYWKTLDEYKKTRFEVDDILEQAVVSLSSKEYLSIITVEGRRGRFDYTVWHIFLHMFNHHSHHRGGVAVLLDELGIENDYSSLLWKV